MGMIGRVLGAGNAVRGVGDAVGGVAEVFIGNRAERDAADNQQYLAAVAQYGKEFEQPRTGRFDQFMDGLNRLPRPLLVMGTLGLFVYAMAAPVGFSLRMQGLALVPEPLWWLLGAIVSFYFGSRELHYQRVREAVAVPPTVIVRPLVDADEGAQQQADTAPPAPEVDAPPDPPAAEPRPAPREQLVMPAPAPAEQKASGAVHPAVVVRANDPHFNAAIEEWRQLRS